MLAKIQVDNYKAKYYILVKGFLKLIGQQHLPLHQQFFGLHEFHTAVAVFQTIGQ